MDAKRARLLAGSAFTAGLLAAIWVAPVAAADCTLTAPASVNVGTTIAIEGAGFPAASSVEIKLIVEGGASDTFPTTTNDSGGLHIDLTPQAADAGTTTVIATAGSTCSAQVVFEVVGTEKTAAPTATPQGQVAAIAAGPGAPRTDTAAALDSGPTGVSRNAWLLALVAMAIGFGGLFATRKSRSR